MFEKSFQDLIDEFYNTYASANATVMDNALKALELKILYGELNDSFIEYYDESEQEEILENIKKLRSMSKDEFDSFIEVLNNEMEDYVREMCGEDEANDSMREYANTKCLELYLKEHPEVNFTTLDEDEKEQFLEGDEVDFTRLGTHY